LGAEVESERSRRDAELLTTIKLVFAEHKGRYGAPRVHAALRHRGIAVSRKRVGWLMRESGLRARSSRKFNATTDSAHSTPVSPNVLERDFAAPRPDVAWVSDITYIWTDEGWLYLCVILDLCSRRVVGWALREQWLLGSSARRPTQPRAFGTRRRDSSSTATAVANMRAEDFAAGWRAWSLGKA
jgi:transposase InsO family protein